MFTPWLFDAFYSLYWAIQLLPVDAGAWHLTDICCTLLFPMVDTTMSSLYKDKKDGENIGITDKNKHRNGLELNLECVIITFNHGVSLFNICCGPWSILMPSTLRRTLILTSGCNKHLTPQIHEWILYLNTKAYKFLLFSTGVGSGENLPVIVNVHGLGIARDKNPEDPAVFSFITAITDFEPKEGGYGGELQ